MSELREVSGRAQREEAPPPVVYAHQLSYTLATTIGAHPRPLDGDQLVPVPVRVALYRPGESEPYAFADARAFSLYPHRPARNGAPESPAELILAVEVPTNE